MSDSITLKEHLESYKKEELKGFADALWISKVANLKKAEIAAIIYDKLIDSDVMYHRLSLLDDKEMKLFEEAAISPVNLTDDNFPEVSRLVDIGYGIMTEDDMFMIPPDVVSIWKSIKSDEFDSYRKKAFWVNKCLYWCEKMYAYFPIENFLDVINIRKGMKMKEDELIAIFDKLPFDQRMSSRIEDVFISFYYALNEDKLRDLRIAQADKDFYIPTVSEVEEFYKDDALISDMEYRDMEKFLMKEIGMDPEEANAFLYDLYDMITREDDPHETIRWFADEVIFDSDKQAREGINLLMNVLNGTRMLIDRGHKPKEILRKTPPGPGNMPTIVAGSSHAAEMLSQIAPEIRSMGFGLDLDSNAAKIPVMGDRGNSTVKKIYPNDPCPCGSGKKYKKCCGRNAR